MIPPDSLKLRVLEAARERPVPPRPDRLPRTIGLVALAAVAMVAVLEWGPPLLGDVGGPAHAAGRPAVAGAWVVAGIVALALGATWIVLPFRRSMLSAPRGVLLAVAVGVPLLVGLWLVLWHSTYEDPFTRVGWRCFALTILTAPWPLAVLAYAGRRAEPRHPGTLGAALGACAGAWAAVSIGLWCPLSTPGHVALGHVAPLVVLALLSAAIGVRMFAVRRDPRAHGNVSTTSST
jgi:hypothetical protein